MKKLNFAEFLFLASISILLFSCSGDDEINPKIEVPVTSVPWEKVQGLSLDVYNSLYKEEKLTILDRNNLFFDTQLDAVGNPQSIVNFLTRLGRYRLPLSKDVFVSRSETQLFLFPNAEVNNENSLVVDPKNYDPTFSSFEDIPFWQGDVLGLDPNGTTVLVPYRTTENGFATSNPNFLLLKIAFEEGKVVLNEHVLIKENFTSYFVETENIRSLSNFFLIQVEGKTYSIDFKGELRLIADAPLTPVELEDQLVFFQENRVEGKIAVWVSDKNGANLSAFGEFTLSLEKLGANYSSVDNQIVGYSGRNLFMVNLGSSSATAQMLNNNGIEGAISSITQVGAEDVLITLVSSGQGGAVIKPVAHFKDEI